MLRCPPSRITLSAADLHEADSRIRARRAARIALFNEANVRLSPGPSHPIRHSTVTEKHESGTLSGVNPVHPSTAFCSAESHDCKDETDAGKPSNIAFTSVEQASHFADSTLDGVADVRPANCPLHCRDQSSQVHVSKTGTADVDELHWHDNSSSPPPGPPTRRLHAASQKFVVHDDPDELQDLIRNRHLDRLPSNEFHPDIPPPVPELVLSAAQVVTEPPVLDPGAPVFVPRIRLANTTCSSEDDSIVNWGSLDSTRNPAHLRLRTSSEQNAEQHSIRQEDDTQLRARSRSGTFNQNAVTHDHVPILERYPLLRPPARQTASRRNSISQRSTQITRRRATRLPSTASLQHLAASRQASINHRTHPAVAVNPSQLENVDNEIPTPLIQPRSSSLAWGRTITPAPNTQPSTVDGSSSVGGAPASRDPSAQHRWDATTEFLNMRRSPLDELTETLSRLSAARPRSVGRSWERTPNSRPKVSLLSGDLFRQDSSPGLPNSPLQSNMRQTPSPEPKQVMRMQIAAQVPAEEPLSLDDLAVLPRVHSPHSPPIPVPSPELPSTPPRPAVNLSSPRRPLDQRSPAKAKEVLTPGSAIRRKPVPSAGATPKVKVYNDSEPPDTQPQTPADVLRTARKSRRGRSGDWVQNKDDASGGNRPDDSSPTWTSQQLTSQQTCPFMSPARTLDPHARHDIRASTVASTSEPILNEQLRRRADSARNTLDRENNEVEGHLEGLEEDRRVWMGRREGGSLDTTPPAEGRYERYLS
ncbi:hypothetical protein D0863_14783 [Hortaea werneckii]|uniref:Uncharacterized protein n=1 Tax=Hortaea werneckii TaxID=91943 RepID=A0A3M7CFM9_HORWE|nr:hypothetical protein D0863_14783 [Hortaea werneckii]